MTIEEADGQVEILPHQCAGKISHRLSLAAVALIAALAGAMQVWQARESLWLDELHTAWCAAGPLAEVAPRAATGNQSPLFFWLEWLLVQACGPRELALRLPSIVAGTLLPLALYCVARRWTGQPWLGVLAAWLVVFEPRQLFNAAEARHFYFATEARPYALVELLAVVHMAVFVELLARPGLGRRMLFVLGGVLLFHLHYTAVLLIPAEIALYLLFRALRPPPEAYAGRSLALDLFLMAAFCLPALGHLQEVFARRGNWTAFVHKQPAVAIVTFWPGSLAAALVLVNADWFTRRAVDRQPLAAIAMLCWLLVPVSLAWLATASGLAPLLHWRYVAVTAPAATLLAALCVRLAPWKSLQIVLGLGIAAFALRSSYMAEQFRQDGRFLADRQSDWRAAIAHFNDQPEHDRHPVLVATALIEADALRTSPDRRLADYCLFPVTSLYPIDAERERLIPLPRTTAGRLDADVSQRIRESGGAWLIIGRGTDAAARIERDVLASLESSGKRENPTWQIESHVPFGSVHVIFLRRGSSPTPDP
jgi:hypothetical protein